MAVFKGSCLCGQVTFKLNGDPTDFYTCHCTRCQKITGTSNAANIFVSRSELDWISGEDRITHFDLSPATFFNAAFCCRCGSPVPRKARSGDFIIVPAGCLDDGPALTTQRTIYWNDRARWFDAVCSAERFMDYDRPVRDGG